MHFLGHSNSRHLGPEDGGSKLHRNVGIYLPMGIKPYLLRPESSSTLLWKPHTLKSMSYFKSIYLQGTFTDERHVTFVWILTVLWHLDKVWHMALLCECGILGYTRFVCLEGALLKTRVFWGVMQCLLVHCCGPSDGPQCLSGTSSPWRTTWFVQYRRP